MAAITSRELIARRQPQARTRGWERAAFAVSGLLAAVSAVAAGATFFVPNVLRGTAVMNGSARGTALVMLVAGEPLLLAAMYLSSRGSLRARVAWLGLAGYFAYNGVMFVLGTPLNQLYLLYEAVLGLSFWTAVLVLRSIDLGELGRAFSVSFPRSAIAAYVLAIVTLNTFLWLSGAVPAVLSTTTAKVLDGTGLTTVPTYDQDLAFWLPLIGVGAIWMWRRVELGRLIVGAALVMWVVEGVGVAADQWMGGATDPSSTVASAAMTPVFAALALIGLVPLYFYMRSLHERPRP